jgi:hypothetical protein
VKVLKFALWGFFGAIGLAIVFVRAGQKSGRSGGQQAADIISAGGSATSQVATALQGG